MVKKQLFYLFYIFCSFTLLVCGEKNILPNFKTNSQEPEPDFFWGPWSRSRSKKIPGAWAAWEKNQEPEPLEKKSGAVATKKFVGSPALIKEERKCVLVDFAMQRLF